MSMGNKNQVSDLELGQAIHPQPNDASSPPPDKQHEGLTLRWKDVKFDVDLPKKAGKREILRGISGLAKVCSSPFFPLII